MTEGFLESDFEASLSLPEAAPEGLEARPDLGNVRYLKRVSFIDNTQSIVDLKARTGELDR